MRERDSIRGSYAEYDQEFREVTREEREALMADGVFDINGNIAAHPGYTGIHKRRDGTYWYNERIPGRDWVQITDPDTISAIEHRDDMRECSAPEAETDPSATAFPEGRISDCCFARILEAGEGGPDVCSRCHDHCGEDPATSGKADSLSGFEKGWALGIGMATVLALASTAFGFIGFVAVAGAMLAVVVVREVTR